jgi:hypothetical protein
LPSHAIYAVAARSLEIHADFGGAAILGYGHEAESDKSDRDKTEGGANYADPMKKGTVPGAVADYLSSLRSKSIVFSLSSTCAVRSVVFGCVYFEGTIGGGRAALCSGNMPSWSCIATMTTLC